MEATLAMKVEELRDANEKVEDLQNSLETLQHLGRWIRIRLYRRSRTMRIRTSVLRKDKFE